MIINPKTLFVKSSDPVWLILTMESSLRFLKNSLKINGTDLSLKSPVTMVIDRGFALLSCHCVKGLQAPIRQE